MGNQICEMEKNNMFVHKLSRIYYELNQKKVSTQLQFLQKRKSFNSYVHPILNFSQGQTLPCDHQSRLLYIEVPQTYPLNLPIIDLLNRTQRHCILLVLLYGFGELYRYIRKGFTVLPQMIRYTSQGDVYVWYHRNLWQQYPQFPNNKGEIALVINLFKLVDLMDIYQQRIAGFIDAIITVRKKLEQIGINSIRKINLMTLREKTKKLQRQYSESTSPDLLLAKKSKYFSKNNLDVDQFNYYREKYEERLIKFRS